MRSSHLRGAAPRAADSGKADRADDATVAAPEPAVRAEHFCSARRSSSSLGFARLPGATALMPPRVRPRWGQRALLDWKRRLWRSACNRITAGINATTESPNAHQYADAKAAEVAAGRGVGERRAEHDGEDGGPDRAAHALHHGELGRCVGDLLRRSTAYAALMAGIIARPTPRPRARSDASITPHRRPDRDERERQRRDRRHGSHRRARSARPVAVGQLAGKGIARAAPRLWGTSSRPVRTTESPRTTWK